MGSSTQWKQNWMIRLLGGDLDDVDAHKSNTTITNNGIRLNLETFNPELEVPRGMVTGQTSINKFGRAPTGVQVTVTDIWDRADSTPTQSEWLAPTAARIHTIASTSAQDATGGVGTNSVTVFYLSSWDEAEATETVTGDINSGIAMSNAAVIIHRMESNPQSTSESANAGTITALAAVDGTVTAQINPTKGQTQMAIYGIPSIQSLFIENFYGTINKAQGAAVSVNFSMVVNLNPHVQTLAFVTKNTRGAQSTGTTGDVWNFNPYLKFVGPAIVKIQGLASAADVEASAGFNAYVIDN